MEHGALPFAGLLAALADACHGLDGRGNGYGYRYGYRNGYCNSWVTFEGAI